MNKIPKEKQNQMAGVAAGALVLVGLIWYFLISIPGARLARLEENKNEFENKLFRADNWIRRSARVAADLTELKQKLGEIESGMPTPAQLNGNKWVRDLLTSFIQSNRHDVTLMRLHQEPLKGRQAIILPNFPYEGASYEVEARAFYHDIGRFLADFENSHPYFRFQTIRLSPIATPSAAAGGPPVPDALFETEERENVRVSMNLVLLYKPPVASP